MKTGYSRNAALAVLLTVVTFLCCSCVYVGDGYPMARHEKEISLSAAMEPGSALRAETRDGSITVRGTDTRECRILATVTTRAWTMEQAKELAEQIDVRLQSLADTIEVIIDRPTSIRNARYSVSLTAEVPTQTGLVLVTSDGSVRVSNLAGNVDAQTSDGSIGVENITGDLKLKTSDGAITCTEIHANRVELRTSDGAVKLADGTAQSATARTSDGSITLENVEAGALELRASDGAIRCDEISATRVSCHTSDGSIHVTCAENAPKAPQVTATTSDGGITFVAPRGLSAAVEAHTNDGTIRTHLPISVIGRIGKHLQGTIGAGEGKVYLETRDGSITIR